MRQKALSAFEDDLELLEEILLGNMNRKKEIERNVKKYIESNAYDDLGEIAPFFRKKVAWLRTSDELEGVERAIRNASILINKKRKMINTDDWEWRVERAKGSNIERVITHYLNPNNPKKRIKCPFHDGKSNHLQVYPKTNTYYCFSCQATGDVIKFVMGYTKSDFKEAVNILQNF